MTRRAVATQADLARAIKEADKAGKVVAVHGGTIYFLAPDAAPVLPSADGSGVDTCDRLFGLAR